MTDEMTRRTFLGTAAVSVGAMATRAKSAPKRGANDVINVGLIGCGSRGPYIAYISQITDGVRLTGCCDVYKSHLDKAIKQAEGVTPGEYRAFGDYRDMLDDKDLNAVIVAPPTHWHVLPAIHACQAGKDVYLEKPVGTSIGEGRALIKAVRENKRIIQMGTQQHSWEHYQRAVEIIRAGTLGEISLVHVWDVGTFHPGFGSPADQDPPEDLDWNFWLGPAPAHAYNPNRFRYNYWFHDYGGAWQVEWGAHHYDIVHWALDAQAPSSAVGLGNKVAFGDDNREWPDTFSGACEYGRTSVAKQGFLMQYTCRSGCEEPLFGRWHGKAFYGTNGVLILDRSGFEIRSQFRDDRKVVVEEKMASTKAEHDVVRDHVANFFRCMRENETPAASIEVGHRATNPGHLMNIAWRVGRKVTWDADRERVINDPEANLHLKKPYRDPWELPV